MYATYCNAQPLSGCPWRCWSVICKYKNRKVNYLGFLRKNRVHCIIGSQENKVRDFDTLLKYLTTKILASADSHILHCPWTCLATAALVQSWSGNSGPLKFKGVKLTNLKFLKIIQKQIIFYKKLPKHKFWLQTIYRI